MFHPIVSAWFDGRFGRPTPVQEKAWPAIAAGRDALIAAPTGSGKTLAAFLGCLDALVRRADAEGSLPDQTHVLYVSPLKALSNDVQRNLERPLAEMADVAAGLGLAPPPIRTALRTGDTTAKDRRDAALRPPHVLVTTPESLFILLTSESGRKGLASVGTVIVDEIHAIAGDKRGAHLALSLERLDDLVVASGRPRPQRIGLSATVRPMEVAARLLVGNGREAPAIVDVGQRRDLDLAVELPRDELGAVCTNEQWDELYARLAELASRHRSTLVFVNTRRLVERVAHHLGARLGEAAVAAHHGSLSRARRFDAERRLKAGELRVVVATASLELGIDVGSVELTCVVGSPRSIATALQRIGRSGHAFGQTPKGRLFPLTRDQLVECAGIVRAARRGVLDAIALRDAPLDVLSQQIVAACAAEPQGEDALFELCRRAAPYASLRREDHDAVVAMLSEGIATRRGRSGALLHRDAVNRVLRGRRGARLTAVTSGGAIPDNANYDVVLEPDGTRIGTLDEDFAIESMAGDVFLLGNTSWRIRRVETGKVRVEDAKGAAPTIPFWLGEAPARTPELSDEVGALREEAAAVACGGGPMAAAAPRGLVPIMDACAVDARGAELLRDYVLAGRAALGAVPSRTTVVAERFFDEAGGMQVVLHAPFGGRINRAWGLALRKRFCRSFDFELQAAATDDGVLLSLGPQHSFPLEAVFEMLDPDGVEEILVQAVLQAPMFGTRWRWNATRALALRRQNGGKRVPPPLLRMRSDDLLAAVFPEQQGCQDNHGGVMRDAIDPPDHPLVKETIRDCLTEAMDVAGLRQVLAGLRSGAIARVAVDTPEPSVFSHEILNANPYAFLDDAPLEERRARAVSVRRGLPAEVADRIGGLDADAIAAVVAEARPEVRDPDELHDVLLDLGALPERDGGAAGWRAHLDVLVAARRAARLVDAGGSALWVAAERRGIAAAVWRERRFEPELAAPEGSPGARAWDRDDALVEIVRARLALAGPITAAELAAALAIEEDDATIALARVENEGNAIRGRFRTGPGAALPGAGAPPADEARDQAGAPSSVAIEFCDRRLLARIHRRTVDRLRAEIEPVTAADVIRFLLSWQGLKPGTHRHGKEGVRRTVAQLQGVELAAGAWEHEVLPARVARYEPAWLDALCLSGEIAWGRLSPRDFATDLSGEAVDAGKSTRRAPTRAAPITLARRKDLAWLLAARGEPSDEGLSDPARAVLRALREGGAAFTDDLAAAAGRAPAEVEEALWELVGAGLVTGDGFSGLRALLAPAAQRSLGDRGRIGRWRRPAAPLVAAGRWALLRAPAPAGEADPVEALARQYLARYGIVFKDLLAREMGRASDAGKLPTWRELLQVYRRLEMRGEIRGGRRVGGVVGEQLAPPPAHQARRAHPPPPRRGEVVRLSACDPLNLVGVITPGPRVPAVLGNVVAFRDGVPIDPAAPAADPTSADLAAIS